MRENAIRGALNKEKGKLPEHVIEAETSAAAMIHRERDEALRGRHLDRLGAPEILGELRILSHP